MRIQLHGMEPEMSDYNRIKLPQKALKDKLSNEIELEQDE
jgi:hypothetical protein